MSDAAIATREFDLDDQLWFASLSGDANPLHVDPVAARRTMLGECVVHGVHTVLWALDEYARSAKLKPCEIALLRVAFRRPVRLGQRVECHVERATGDSFELRVVDAAGGVFADIRVATRPATSADSGGRMGPLENVECADLDFDEAANVSGETRLSLDALTLEKRFGSLARTFPLLQTAEVLATTRIVGMFCPGRNSLFGAIKLESRHAEDAPQVVQYETERAEPRYSIIDVSVNGPTLSGTLNTFYRPPPQQQAGVNRAQDIVEQSEFRGQRAVVIGGSRGLGEVTAKLLAAGGAELLITYASGRREAEQVASEIESIGGACEIAQLDCLRPDEHADRIRAWSPDRLYYFATPFIRIEKSRAFDPGTFERLCRFYVSGLYATLEAIVASDLGRLTLFYPSTVFLDDPVPGTTEYAAAKAAGEQLCRHLETAGLRYFAPRLPRMRTDQTVTLAGEPAPDALETIASALREMERAIAATTNVQRAGSD